MSRLVDSVKEISGFSSSRGFIGKIQGDLVRRITLLSPFFEELIDVNVELKEDQIAGFEVMRIALDSSLELFRSVHGGSKLFQVTHLLKLSFICISLVAGKVSNFLRGFNILAFKESAIIEEL